MSRQRKARVSGRFGVVAAVALLAAIPAGAQSRTEVWAGISVGVFDGFGIGMTRYAHGGSFGLGATVATGTTGYPDYGVYSRHDRGRRLGDHRYGRDYADYCWDRAWDLRWGRDYYGGWGGWGSPAYDHLDFYHDCLGGGVDYAYDRWYAHTRHASWGRPWCEWGCRGGGVTVAVYVKDPFWAPWGPYWAYDPWGWYWDGHRDGFPLGRRGWSPRGRIGYGAVARTAWVDRGRGWTRASPLASPRFEGNPAGRTAVPRGGRTIAAADAPTPRERPTARVPARAGDGPGEPRVARARPTDGLRGRGYADGPRDPAARPPREPRDEPRAEPRRADADGGGRAAPRARPSAPRGGGDGALDRARTRSSERPSDAPSARARPGEGRSSGGAERSAPTARGERPSVRSEGGRRSRGDARPAPSRRSGSDAAPRRR